MKKCLICNSASITLSNRLTYFDVMKCANCEVLFANEFPTSKKIMNIYSVNYYSPWTDSAGTIPMSVELMKKKTFRAYLNLLPKYIKLKGKKLLDIGCATGFLLETAKEKGCDCWGVELNPFGAKESSKKFPRRIFNGILEKSKFKDGFFDIITMVDLIEHTQNPLAVMKEVLRITKKGGYVLMVTPNVGGMWAKVLGKKWTNFKEEHLFYFKETSLRYMINKSGFNFIFGKPVTKTLTLRYICNQLYTYKTPFLSTVVKLLRFFPNFVLDFPFPIKTGDYLILINK